MFCTGSYPEISQLTFEVDILCRSMSASSSVARKKCAAYKQVLETLVEKLNIKMGAVSKKKAGDMLNELVDQHKAK